MSKYQVEQITKEAEFRMRADKTLTMEQAEIIHDMAVEEETPEDIDIWDFEELPTEEVKFTMAFKVTGNAGQIRDLETFLNAIFGEWEEV